jgi:hypothetical protein
MKTAFGLGAAILCIGTVAAPASQIDIARLAASARPAAPSIAMPASRAPIRMAQAACWYAILHCARSSGEATRWSERNGGQVINTSSDEFPNFQRGYHCVVIGPMSRAAALAEARQWKSSGRSRAAYAKESGC